jgi:hypothetical protein
MLARDPRVPLREAAMSRSLLRSVVIPALAAFACIAGLGFILFQQQIFMRTMPAFAIVAYGLVCSAFFFTHRKFPREAFAVLIVAFVLYEALINHEVGYQLYGRDLLYFGVLTIAMVLYVRYFDRSRTWDHRLAPLVLGFMLLAGMFVGVSILYLWWKVYRRVPYPRFLLTVLQTFLPATFLVGIGLGIGVILDERGILRRGEDALRKRIASV